MSTGNFFCRFDKSSALLLVFGITCILCLSLIRKKKNCSLNFSNVPRSNIENRKKTTATLTSVLTPSMSNSRFSFANHAVTQIFFIIILQY